MNGILSEYMSLISRNQDIMINIISNLNRQNGTLSSIILEEIRLGNNLNSYPNTQNFPPSSVFSRSTLPPRPIGPPPPPQPPQPTNQPTSQPANHRPTSIPGHQVG